MIDGLFCGLMRRALFVLTASLFLTCTNCTNCTNNSSNLVAGRNTAGTSSISSQSDGDYQYINQARRSLRGDAHYGYQNDSTADATARAAGVQVQGYSHSHSRALRPPPATSDQRQLFISGIDRRSYLPDTYFTAESQNAKLLRMGCSDPRFGQCLPKTSPLIHILNGTKREEYTNYNPSMVHINPSMFNLFEYGEFVVVKRLNKDNCGNLNDTSTPQDPRPDTIIVQILDSYLNPIAQTYVQVCSPSLVFNVTSVSENSRYKSDNEWLGDVNGYRSETGEPCGLLAGEDTRIFYLYGELYILNQCYEGTCRGEKGIYWIPLHLRRSSEDGQLVAYVVEGTSDHAMPGRNFVFFTVGEDGYLLSSFYSMGVLNIKQHKQAETVDPIGLSKIWHLHGGNVVHWHTDRHRGFLGISHKHAPYGLNHVGYGSMYVSALFLISASEPFELLKFSRPFCFASLEYPDKCELIQFICSVTVSKGHLIIGYGVNDCEARFWSMSVEEVDFLLHENGLVEGAVYKGSGRSVYLYRNETFHEFPNVDTFASMGFDFEQVTLIADEILLPAVGDPVPPV
jgi:hypothetical protein